MLIVAAMAVGLSATIGLTFVGTGARSRAAEGAGGAGGAIVSWPRRLTAGESRSRIFGPGKVAGAELRGMHAARLEASKLRFNGVLAGVRIVDPEAGAAVPRCSLDLVTGLGEGMLRAAGTFVEVDPETLPRGTFEIEAPFGEACDGRVTTVSRQYQLLPYGGTLGIVRRFGTNIVPIATSRDRIRVGSIDGHSAVFVLPVTPEGFGDSAILVADRGSVTIIAADSIAFEDLLHVARGVI